MERSSPKARETMMCSRVESTLYSASAWPRSSHDSAQILCMHEGRSLKFYDGDCQSFVSQAISLHGLFLWSLPYALPALKIATSMLGHGILTLCLQILYYAK